MGTETKLNCYTESTATGVVNTKLVKGSTVNTTTTTNHHHHHHQQQPDKKHFYYYYNNGKQTTTTITTNNNGGTTTNKQNNSLLKNNKLTTTQSNVNNTIAASTKPHIERNTQCTTTTVPFVPIFIDENNVIDGAKEILKVIRPHWDINQVQFKKFTDGITNKLVGCFYQRSCSPTSVANDAEAATSSIFCNVNCSKGSTGNATNNGIAQLSIHDDTNDSGNLSDATEDIETYEPSYDVDDVDDDDVDDVAAADADGDNDAATTCPTNNVVLVRVYGNKTDLLIDRIAETENIILLHSYGMAPSLYATFKNGLAYDYVPGVTLNDELILRPEVWRLVASRMAEMHRRVARPGVANEPTPPIPMLWKKINCFFDLVPERFTDPDKHKRLEHTFLPISRIRNEFIELYDHLVALDSPIVFAHNDLLLGNVVYTESQQAVNFIDYEYADYNFQAFDIGNHFAEFAGVEVVDYARYPTKDFQVEWLRVYLQEYLQRTDVTALEVERLYVQVNKFALAAHFFWTIWCLIQAEHSKIDFDYVDYAFVRYNEYLKQKDEFLALQMPRS